MMDLIQILGNAGDSLASFRNRNAVKRSSVPQPSTLFHGLPDPLVVQIWPKVPDAPTGNMALGRAVHSALCENFAQKVDTREDLPTRASWRCFVKPG